MCFTPSGRKNGGQTFTIGKGVLSYACQCVRKLDARQRLAVTEGLEADVSDTMGDDHFRIWFRWLSHGTSFSPKKS